MKVRLNDPRKKPTAAEKAKFRKVEPFEFEQTTANTLPGGSRKALMTGVDEYAGPWSETEATHLLKRTLFGVKQSEIDYFKGLSMSDAVDQIVASSPLPDPPVNDYAQPGSEVVDPDVPSGQTWVEAPYNNDLEGYRILSLKSWIIKNILSQETTLQEKMTLFWHNLLVTQFFDVFVAKGSYKYYKMLYENAFGNFKVLIKELTIDPAMLFFLNGTSNNKEAPDENYARELQELFCIGKGPNANFIESDVQEAAKILTGWVINGENFDAVGELSSFFYPDWHDTSDKQFSSFYDNTVITGRSGAAGAEETDELLDMIFDNQETALYLCRRLYNFFVYHEIDATTEANVIEPLAATLRSNNYEIMPVLLQLFKSEHFYDVDNHGAAIKNPADHLLGMWRSMEVDLTGYDIYELFFVYVSLIYSMSEVGMDIGDPPSVSGWQAYYQEPTFDKFWINTDTITKRAIRSDSLLLWGHYANEDLQVRVNLMDFAETLSDPGNPNTLIADCARLLLGIELTSEVSDGMKSILLSGQVEDFYWTDAWNLYQSDKGNQEYLLTVETRLQGMFQPLLQLSESQLM